MSGSEKASPAKKTPELDWMRTEWGKANLTSLLFALPRKRWRFSQSIANPWIRKDGVRGVNTAPRGVMICDGDSETVRLVAELKGVDVDEVVEEVAVVTMDKLHKTNKDFKKLEVFITDIKKYLVVINIDIRF